MTTTVHPLRFRQKLPRTPLHPNPNPPTTTPLPTHSPPPAPKAKPPLNRAAPRARGQHP